MMWCGRNELSSKMSCRIKHGANLKSNFNGVRCIHRHNDNSRAYFTWFNHSSFEILKPRSVQWNRIYCQSVWAAVLIFLSNPFRYLWTCEWLNSPGTQLWFPFCPFEMPDVNAALPYKINYSSDWARVPFLKRSSTWMSVAKYIFL